MLPRGRARNCNCRKLKWDAAGIVYEELLHEENVELAQRYRIMACYHAVVRGR